MMKELKPMLASYARSFIAASLAVYMAGVTDPKAIASAGIAAVLPVLMRWANPHDKVYGRK
jgi:uncharacterized membrane protein YgaE (UPF0421/DUF939 family)